jgi:hypothetical protein
LGHQQGTPDQPTRPQRQKEGRADACDRGADDEAVSGKHPYDERESTPARLLNSAAEVREAGGQVHWTRGANFFSEIATVEFLIQAPDWLKEDAEVHFYNIAEDGTRYTRAVATFASTSYSGVAVPLATSLRTHLAATGLKGGQWELGSVIMTKADKTWWTPTIRTAGLVTEAQKNLISSLSM